MARSLGRAKDATTGPDSWPLYSSSIDPAAGFDRDAKFATLPNGFRYIDWSKSNSTPKPGKPKRGRDVTPFFPALSTASLHSSSPPDELVGIFAPRTPRTDRSGTHTSLKTAASGSTTTLYTRSSLEKRNLAESRKPSGESMITGKDVSDPFMNFPSLPSLPTTPMVDRKKVYGMDQGSSTGLAALIRDEEMKLSSSPHLPRLSLKTSPSQLTYDTFIPTSPEASSPAFSDPQTPTRFKGYPRGPQDPEWDEAVKRVKKMVAETEKREALEASKQAKELSVRAKKAQKLRAGKAAIMRGSQFGFATRKPVEDITEEEFEAVGAFSNAAAAAAEQVTPKGSKVKTLGALFTKMRGSALEREEQVARTRTQLEKHKSLEVLLASSTPGGASSGDEEDLRHYDEVLRLLKCDEWRNEEEERSPTVGKMLEHRARRSGKYGILPSPDKMAVSAGSDVDPHSIGLGITTNDKVPAPSPSAHTSSTMTKSPQPQDLVAECIRRPGGNNESADEDGGSWCTESVYSQDEADEHKEETFLIDDSSPEGASANDSPDFAPHGSAGNIDGNESKGELDELDAVPAPLNIKVLKVRPSLTQLRSSDAGSFAPERQGSFRAKIQAASRLQKVVIGSRSHPALRAAAEEQALLDERAKLPRSSTIRARSGPFDAELAPMPNVPIHQKHQTAVTEPIPQRKFASDHTPSPKKLVSWQQQSPLPGSGSKSEQPAQDVDIQKLRASVGLPPLLLACGSDSLKHPNHPFTWNHEKVMCRQIHTPDDESAPSPPRNLGNAFAQAQEQQSTTCPLCGAQCCHFARLLTTSQRKSTDVTDAVIKNQAARGLQQLRSLHPNGVEDYDTFLPCFGCGTRVCPKCAIRCGEAMCAAVVCARCAEGAERCPVHNFF